jgi:hypothetical protein
MAGVRLTDETASVFRLVVFRRDDALRAEPGLAGHHDPERNGRDGPGK